MNFIFSTLLGNLEISVQFKTAPKISKKAKGIYQVLFEDKVIEQKIEQKKVEKKIEQKAVKKKSTLAQKLQKKIEKAVEYKSQVNGPSLQVVNANNEPEKDDDSEDLSHLDPHERLNSFIHEQNWTQKSLSEKTGISQADISKMIHGKRAIGSNVAKKLANAFAVDYRSFL